MPRVSNLACNHGNKSGKVMRKKSKGGVAPLTVALFPTMRGSFQIESLVEAPRTHLVVTVYIYMYLYIYIYMSYSLNS